MTAERERLAILRRPDQHPRATRTSHHRLPHDSPATLPRNQPRTTSEHEAPPTLDHSPAIATPRERTTPRARRIPPRRMTTPHRAQPERPRADRSDHPVTERDGATPGFRSPDCAEIPRQQPLSSGTPDLSARGCRAPQRGSQKCVQKRERSTPHIDRMNAHLARQSPTGRATELPTGL
jgi:hypothetical protein